jgi:hypothetical protein
MELKDIKPKNYKDLNAKVMVNRDMMRLKKEKQKNKVYEPHPYI